MKQLLVVTSVLEVGAGLALIAVPSSAALLVIGAPLTTPAAVTTARIGASGLLALGVACGLAGRDVQSGVARALVAGMLIYNVAASGVLAAAGIQSQPVGIVLWPAVVLHLGMAAWCTLELVRRPTRYGR